MPLVAGIDCSTQSTKALIVDLDSGTVVAEGRAGHEVTGTGGARETDPEIWWGALRDALAATIILVGGGAQGAAWRRLVGSLSGRSDTQAGTTIPAATSDDAALARIRAALAATELLNS